MDKLFLTILNMSLTGAFVIAAICVARLPLKKAPKIISYCLWAVAGFRLVFPFSIESVFSLIPFKAQTIPSDIVMQTIPRIDSGIPFVNNAVSGILPAATPTASVNPLQIWATIGAWVWVTGVAVLLIYGMASLFILKHKMSKAAHMDANIYEAENIKSPFVLGIFKPMIYLPIGLSEQEKSYIILHEQTHIRRRDHIVKFASYFVLCLHWFNLLAWVAFLLMGVDMEMSCDERVLKEMGGETKKDYSLSLLSLATDRRIIGGSPLAFGEGGIKERVKNILNFKKTSRVIIIAAVALVAVLGMGFAVNKASQAINTADWEIYDFPNKSYDSVFFECNDMPYNPEYFVISAQLMNNQNVPGLTCGESFTLVKQVGNVWKAVPFADGLGFDDIAFQLENGLSFDYSIRPEMLSVILDEGNYRIVTEVWYPTDRVPTLGGSIPPDSPAFYNTAKHTVWADFAIDKNAPKQETYEFGLPSGVPEKTYFLENPTERQRFERLPFVSLYSNGVAWLATPPISSYMLPNCTYAFVDDELLIYANIEAEKLENAFGVKNGEVIARFTVVDDNTLVFQSANVTLFADKGARYVSDQPADTNEIISPDILGKIYLGMTSAEVYELLGEPDFQGSGLYFVGYDDVGSFYFSGNFYEDSGLQSYDITTRISMKEKNWDINELVSAAVKRQITKEQYAYPGEFQTESHINLAMDADENGFTIYVVSLYETFLPDGEYNVKSAGGYSAPLSLTFKKNTDGNYELTEFWKPEDGSYYMPSIRSKFPKETWDRIDTQLYVKRQSQNCYDDAMYFFVGAVPRDGRYGIGAGTAALTGVAEDIVENECFMIKYFPGATIQIEEYDEEHATYKPSSWIIEYADSSKNIIIGKDGMGEIPITDDLIGIYDVDENQHAMKFEKYVKTE